MDRAHILFVDDDVLAQWILAEVLHDAGFQVTSVCRAEEAIRLLRTTADFDLLLTDVALPDEISGVELANHWRLAQPGRPVVYATCLARSVIGLLEDDEAFIQKPCRGDDLLRVIDDALDEALLYSVPKASIRRSAWVN